MQMGCALEYHRWGASVPLISRLTPLKAEVKWILFEWERYVNYITRVKYIKTSIPSAWVKLVRTISTVAFNAVPL